MLILYKHVSLLPMWHHCYLWLWCHRKRFTASTQTAL